MFIVFYFAVNPGFCDLQLQQQCCNFNHDFSCKFKQSLPSSWTFRVHRVRAAHVHGQHIATVHKNIWRSHKATSRYLHERTACNIVVEHWRKSSTDQHFGTVKLNRRTSGGMSDDEADHSDTRGSTKVKVVLNAWRAVKLSHCSWRSLSLVLRGFILLIRLLAVKLQYQRN